MQTNKKHSISELLQLKFFEPLEAISIKSFLAHPLVNVSAHLLGFIIKEQIYYISLLIEEQLLFSIAKWETFIRKKWKRKEENQNTRPAYRWNQREWKKKKHIHPLFGY